ncbi:hypothetical protein PUN28_006138 [Cardiocondyla obscurior]|uniref:Uncharacterized protein n=1 Tax=Cardiocondyla obscurior TaxID=286306 RepID=A0AAW2GA83_9HYME
MGDRKGSAWVQDLNKEQILEELRVRNIPCDQSERFNKLRRKLSKIVKIENSAKLGNELSSSDDSPITPGSNEATSTQSNDVEQ